MKSKVFVSCGQAPGEREVARKVGKLLEGRGFNVYIAIDVQTIHEIDTGIIRELKESDCYLFVNFCRERINRKSGGKYRGSLFSNQELAIAYAFGLKRILVINQHGILPEGMLRYIGINSETFVDFDDCCAVVERALDRCGWTTDAEIALSMFGSFVEAIKEMFESVVEAIKGKKGKFALVMAYGLLGALAIFGVGLVAAVVVVVVDGLH